MPNSLLTQLQNHFPELSFQGEVALAAYTYMRVGGPAEVLWRAQRLTDLVDVVRFVRQRHWPLTVFGGASNVVIRDGGIRGLVIINECNQVQIPADLTQLDLPAESVTKTAGTKQFVLAESGIKTALLIRATIDAGLTGLEPFLGVPGTLGGAIYNNSHYTEELIGNYVVAVEVAAEDGHSYWLPASVCEFSYDHSRFHHTQEIILRVLFALSKGDAPTSLQKITTATQKRAATQPLGEASSGCMFQNVTLTPAQQERFGKKVLSAGWLIDQAGLKGLRVGDASVSTKHANFVINEGRASYRDIEQLIQKVQQAVEQQFGIHLEPEVFFLGEPKKGS